MFLADNIGNNTSINSISNVLLNEKLIETKPAVQTVQSYVATLLEAYVFYEIKRFDIKGKEFLKTLPFKNIAELSKTLDKVIKGTEDVTEEIDSIAELKNFLKGFKRGDTLQDSLENLWNRVVGDPIPSKDFLTLKGIEDFVLKYKTTNDSKVNTLLEELNHIETGVGLNAEGSFSPDPDTNYLTEATSVMHALRILDKTLKRYVSVNAPQVRNNDEAVKLSITQELDSYVLGATLKLSTQAGNQLIKNTDGFFDPLFK